MGVRIGYSADSESLLRLTPFRVARRGAVTKQNPSLCQREGHRGGNVNIVGERIGYSADLKSLLRLTPFRVACRGAVTKQKLNKKQLCSLFLFLHLRLKVNFSRRYKNKKRCLSTSSCFVFVSWELTDSNRRPSACKADALNQLS